MHQSTLTGITAETRACARCGEHFARRINHGPWPKYCSAKCKRAVEYTRLGKPKRKLLVNGLCGKCGELKPPEAFYLRHDAPKRRSICKQCAASAARSRYQASRDDELERRRSWYEGNRDLGKARSKAWAKANPEKVRAIQLKKRTAKRASSVGAISADLIQARVDFFGGKCWMCGGPFEHLDHVKPLSKGGPHMLSNLRPACAPCNGSKSARWYGVGSLSHFIRS